jgi:hypothetical protein
MDWKWHFLAFVQEMRQQQLANSGDEEQGTTSNANVRL